jgi:hypothetical protein
MCLTGGFALAMMVDPVVVAPVLSQPSLPVGLTKRARRDLGISEQDLAVVQDRVAGGTCVMALRFSEDGTAPKERFGRLREVLGENFIGVELDSSEGNEWGYPQSAHSVLTDATSFDLASPAGKALRDVVAFFTRQLEVAV